MGSRSHLARLGVALAGASAALLTFALPATAAPHASSDQFAHVDYKGNAYGGEVFLEGGKTEPTTLIGLKMDDEKSTVVQTYCVEMTVAAHDGAEMKESRWSDYPAGEGQFKSQPKKVNWVLHHSFPGKTLKDVSDESGVTVTEVQAVAATQAAIWHYSNGAKIDRSDKNPKPVVDLYDYLTGDKNAGDVEQPSPSLTITPGELAGHAGDKIGPFTVASTAAEVDVAVTGPKGVKLVDKDGNAVTHVKSGAEVFVKVPADVAAGEAAIQATAMATIEHGRLFVGVGDRTQTLIVASPKKAKLTAAATVKWALVPPTTTTPPSVTAMPTTTPAVVAPTTTPVNTLPNTGASVLPVMGIGALLIAAGAAALFLRRRGHRA